MSRSRAIAIGDMLAEFDGESLGDARLDERLRRIVALASVDPGLSFPDQMESVADREALYRFLANAKVTLAGVLSGHLQQTQERMKGRRLVRILHDTTMFHYHGEREGLSVLRGGARGFLAHVALAVAADESREPLGVLGVLPYIHADAAAHRGWTRRERIRASQTKGRADKESSRWEGMALTVSGDLPDGVDAVHIMDQEADDYDVLAALHAGGARYVIRASPTRQTAEAKRPLREVLASTPGTVFRTVRVNPRRVQKAVTSRGRHPERSERLATLEVRWGTVTLARGQFNEAAAPTVAMHAVHVVEPAPPAGEAPIEWMLFTSDRVASLEEAAAVVDHYRARWLIEEYFKALKTGCAFEKRQLTHLAGLVRALAVFVPMAWRLLLLRHLGRAAVPGSVAALFDAEQVRLLRHLLKRRGYRFPSRPSMRDAMLGIAALGGHIKQNGPPGWLVLGRGFTRFLETEIGWRLAREQM